MGDSLGCAGVYVIHSSNLKCQYFHVIVMEDEWFNNLKVFNIGLAGLLVSYGLFNLIFSDFHSYLSLLARKLYIILYIILYYVYFMYNYT